MLFLAAVLLCCGGAGLIHYYIYLWGETPLIPLPLSIGLIAMGVIGTAIAASVTL